MASIQKRPKGTWRARYRDAAGKEHARHFKRKVDAQQWLNEVTASLVRGDYIEPAAMKMTVAQWCDRWLEGYATHRTSTVRQARVHIALIKAEFGDLPLTAVKPSHVKRWTAKMQAEGRAQSYIYATYRRLAQVMGDAVQDDLLRKSPCSKRTAPAAGEQLPYLATTEQVWGLYDAFPAHLRPAVLLGAFVGLRVSEAAALRVQDVDFMRGVVTPDVQYPAEPLKTKKSRTPVPIPGELSLMLSVNVDRFGAETIVTNEIGRSSTPWAIERAMRVARGSVEGLPAGFRFHDLRHYLASLLIGQGLDVKVVQERLRHASAKTTLDTYGHMWPDSLRTTGAL